MFEILKFTYIVNHLSQKEYDILSNTKRPILSQLNLVELTNNDHLYISRIMFI